MELYMNVSVKSSLNSDVMTLSSDKSRRGAETECIRPLSDGDSQRDSSGKSVAGPAAGRRRPWRDRGRPFRFFTFSPAAVL